MWKAACKVSDVAVDSTPVIFVSDSVDGSVDSGMSDIVIEFNSCTNVLQWQVVSPGIWTAVFLAETLEKFRKYQNQLKDKG